jgi:hypothetical protein
MMKRVLLKIVDELQHSKDGTTCRLIKTQKTNYPSNGHIMRNIQYLELRTSKGMDKVLEKNRQKKIMKK